MKNVLSLVVILSFWAQVLGVTIGGQAYLDGETDHSGIEVILQRTAPDTNFRDTLLTDETGYYSFTTTAGWYETYYSKTYWFISDSLMNINGYSDINLDDVSLLKRTSLSGSIYGTLPAGEYEVSGSILVEDADTLIIEPGTTLRFHTGTEMKIDGLLVAEGTESDSIRFTSMPGSDWNGLYFYLSTAPVRLNYCLVENSVERGIDIYTPDTEIINSRISNNQSAYYAGGGISFTGGGTHRLTNSVIENNYYNHLTNPNSHGGGGINFASSLIIDNCIIRDNTSTKFGGGISGLNANLTINNSILENNTSGWSGGALCVLTYTTEYYKLNIENSIIKNNVTGGNAGGIYVYGGYYGDINNSIIYSNGQHGIYLNSCKNFNVVNLTIQGNGNTGIFINPFDNDLFLSHISNCIVSGNSGNGIESDNFVPAVTNNNSWNNSGSNYLCGDFVGVEVTTNANGYSCDAYENISADPQFLDEWNGDLILTSASPCIDAGTNEIDDYEFPIADFNNNYRIYDGNGDESAIVDIGAYEYGSYSVGIGTENSLPIKIELYQNYPNPFNPVTTINFTLSSAAEVELHVYNLNGQLVKTLVNGRMDKGLFKTEFKADNLTSGLYIYNLKVDGKSVQSRKMMLIK
jgi:hypothetical protein